MPLIDRLARATRRIATDRYRIILIGALVVAALAGLAATRLRFDPDILNLVPRNDRDVNNFKRVLQQMGTIDQHIVVVELPKGSDISEYAPLLDSLADGYRKLPSVDGIDYRIPNPLDLVDQILPRIFLLLSPAELEQVAARLSDEGIRQSVARNAALLQTPQSAAMKPLIQYDPFNLLSIFLAKFHASSEGMKIDAASGYYASADHSLVLLLVHPKRPAQDIPFAQQLLRETSDVENRAAAAFRRDHPSSKPPAIGHTGTYAVALEDAELIRKDVIANVIFSLVGVLVLFLYAFRRPASLAYAAVPMMLAILITAGGAALIRGKLSFSSTTFAALLAGLGVDFITVFYARYVDERNRGRSTPEAIETVTRTTLPGVALAAVTTAATFYAYLACDFRGMSELGGLTATGIVIFFFCVVLLLPALIVLTEKMARKPPRLFLNSFGSNRIIQASLNHPRFVLWAWAIGLGFCALAATRIEFSDSVENLRAKGNAAYALQQRVSSTFGSSFGFMMYAVEGKSVDEALAQTYEAVPRLDALVQRGAVASYQSIGSFLPPRERQQQVINTLTNDRSGRFDPMRIDATFRSSLEANGFGPEAYDHYLQLFGKALRPTEPMTLESFDDPVISSLLKRFIKKTPAAFMSVTYLYPPKGDWGRELSPPLREFAAQEPRGILTGINIITGTLRRIVRSDAIRSTLIGVAIVFLLFFAVFRKLGETLMVFVPCVAGVIGMLGLMALAGLQFNFINVYVGLFLLGVATDYAIYMIQRYREDPATFAQHAPDTGKAVLMAALTSILGFGSFAISHYPGLRSIGYACTCGLSVSCLAAITLLPVLLARKRVAPGQFERGNGTLSAT